MDVCLCASECRIMNTFYKYVHEVLTCLQQVCFQDCIHFRTEKPFFQTLSFFLINFKFTNFVFVMIFSTCFEKKTCKSFFGTHFMSSTFLYKIIRRYYIKKKTPKNMSIKFDFLMIIISWSIFHTLDHFLNLWKTDDENKKLAFFIILWSILFCFIYIINIKKKKQ